MDILKINTSPVIEVIPRNDIDVAASYTMTLKNEDKQSTQTRACTFVLLPNENYRLTLNSFPTSSEGSKFSYTVKKNSNNEVVLMGRLMVVGETQSVQDYTKTSINKFYK